MSKLREWARKQDVNRWVPPERGAPAIVELQELFCDLIAAILADGEAARLPPVAPENVDITTRARAGERLYTRAQVERAARSAHASGKVGFPQPDALRRALAAAEEEE